jgi:oxygen-independent coproporphyrinogen-3 oxidase
MRAAANKLGIYLQVPFCQTKCTYCNFHTGVVSAGRFAPYVEAVCQEILRHREFYRAAGVNLPEGFEKAIVDTVYFGGGTPSLLEPELLGRMIGTIRETFAAGGASPSPADQPLEVTLEADPETVTVEKAAAWVSAGINRVSFGTSVLMVMSTR